MMETADLAMSPVRPVQGVANRSVSLVMMTEHSTRTAHALVRKADIWSQPPCSAGLVKSSSTARLAISRTNVRPAPTTTNSRTKATRSFAKEFTQRVC